MEGVGGNTTSELKPVNTYNSWNHKSKIYGTYKCLDNPLNIIKNAYSMKVDTTQWQSNRDGFSRLYKSLKNASISHQDILMMVGNPYAQTIQNWKNIPEARRQIIRKEYPEMDVATAAYLKWEAEKVHISNIKEGVDDCSLDFAMFASGIKGVVSTATTAWKLFFSRKVTETAVKNATKIEKVVNDCLTEAERKGFRGIRGKIEFNTPKGMARNRDTMINGRKYWGHVLDRMQDRGVPISAIESCIKTGKRLVAHSGREKYYDAVNKLSVVVDKKSGDVVTVMWETLKCK